MSKTVITTNLVEVAAARAAHGGYRLVMIAVAGLALLAGLTVGFIASGAQAEQTIEPELANLLRLMALLKLGLVVAAAWLVDWRLRQPCDPRLALGYSLAVALMALAPGLVWFMTGLITASVLFHTGLILGLILAFGDGRFAFKRGRPDLVHAEVAAPVISSFIVRASSNEPLSG